MSTLSVLLDRRRVLVGVLGMTLAVTVFAGPEDATRTAARLKPIVAVEGATLLYQGLLDADAIGTVRDLLASNKQIRMLSIESVGGDINLGMDLGELVQKHRLDVRATGEGCISSCANYVFVAGRNKSIDPDAAVIWHGSAIQAGLAEKVDLSSVTERLGRPISAMETQSLQKAVASYLRKAMARQARFYRKLGVDQRLTVFGQEVRCDCSWTIPVADMRRFGLSNVEAPADYGVPAAEWRDKNWKLLRLGDYPQYEQRLGD